MRRLTPKTPLVLGTLAVTLFAAPGSAQAAVSCGDLVDHNITLHQDLDCSGSGTDGLIVGHDGITIDLNGHTITGPGNAKNGIYSEAFDNLTIRDGTVKDFSVSI